jgi:ribosomal protein S18 acetylase RimI-like enzyme
MDHNYTEKVRDSCVVVAEDDGVVGVMVLVVRPRHLFIENIAVEPTRQRAGIGRALLYHAEEEARQRGLAEVQLYTNAAMTENLALYKRIGYVETEHRVERGFARVYMSKPLVRST